MKDSNKFVTSEEAWRVFKNTGNIEAFMLYGKLKEMEAAQEFAPEIKNDKSADK